MYQIELRLAIFKQHYFTISMRYQFRRYVVAIDTIVDRFGKIA